MSPSPLSCTPHRFPRVWAQGDAWDRAVPLPGGAEQGRGRSEEAAAVGAALCHGIKRCCSWILVSEASDGAGRPHPAPFSLGLPWGMRSGAEHTKMTNLMVPAPGWHVQALQLLPLYPCLKNHRIFHFSPLCCGYELPLPAGAERPSALWAGSSGEVQGMEGSGGEAGKLGNAPVGMGKRGLCNSQPLIKGL